MRPDEERYHELCYYTLSHPGSSFIHQHVVDAYAAQRADAGTKPITLTFALVGLYLRVEKGYSGREVQQLHMRLARHKERWPSFVIPEARGSLTVADVLSAPAGEDRDRMIDAWCASVWDAYRESHERVGILLKRHGIV